MTEFDDDVRAFTARIHDSDSFTKTVSDWLRAPVSYVSLRHEYRPATADDAAVLGVPEGSEVLSRRGWLEVVPRQVMADVHAVVVMHRLSEDARHALEARKTPLGLILDKAGIRRHTRAVTRVTGVDACGSQVLRVDAVLTVAGLRVAVVHELVYRQLFDRSEARDVPTSLPRLATG